MPPDEPPSRPGPQPGTSRDGGVGPDAGQVVPGNRWDLLDVPALGRWTPTRRVTVVLPYFQAPDALENTLAGIARQTYPADLVQVVVADDGSTPPLLLPTGYRGLDITVVHQEDRGFGLARARNTGAGEADGDILVFLDCDMVPEPHHLEAHARWHHACDHAVTLGFRRHVEFDGIGPDDIDAAARTGSLEPLFDGRSWSEPVWLERHMERMQELTADHDDLFRATTGGNLGVRAATFHAVGGFDETFTQWGSEDTDIGHRLFVTGALLVPERRAACWHQGDSRGLEPHERTSLNQQRARISQTVAHPGFRRVAPGRSFAIPRLLLDVAVDRQDHATITATVESVLASDLHDLEVLLRIPDDHPDRIRLQREWSGDPRVVHDRRDEHVRTPYRVELPVGTRLVPASLDAIVAALSDPDDPVGVLRIPLDATAGAEVVAVSSRAIGRAAHVGGDDDHEVAAQLFGQRSLDRAQVGLRWAPVTDVSPVPRPTLGHLSRQIARANQGSAVGPWLLIDSPLGWLTRGAVGTLLRDADRAVADAERDAQLARHDAAMARYERDRLRNRKVVRLATEMADTAASRSLRTLPGRLRTATHAVEQAAPPTPPRPSKPARTSRRAAGDIEDRGLLPPRPARAPAFPHLRVLHLGAAARFGVLAPHTAVSPERWRDQLREGADLVLIEPPGQTPDWDPLDGEVPDLLEAATELGIPTIRLATTSSPQHHGRPTLDLVEDVRPGTQVLSPSIDTSVMNPIGWQHQPPDPVVAVLGRRPDDGADELLATFDPPVVLVHPPDLSDDGDGTGLHRSVANPTELHRALIRAGVLLDHPSWRGTPADTLRTWMAALACGTPVVLVDEQAADGGALQLSDGAELPIPPGVLVTTPPGAAEVVHQLLVDPDLRERHGIVGRRWALDTGSRQTALRRILDHLQVPAPPPPRTTVLLATNRPEFIERGLANVARQTQSDVDVCLVLHGSRFDQLDPPGRDGLVSSVIRAPDSWLLGDCLNAALDQARGELVAKMDDDDHYGPDHLRDLVTAWGYSGADLVGKRVEYVHLAQRGITLRRPTSRPERHRPHVGGPTLFGARETLRRHRFLRVPNRVDSTLYERVLADGGTIYGIHSRDLVLERHGHGHAWAAEDDEFLRNAIDVRDGLALDLATSDPATGT